MLQNKTNNLVYVCECDPIVLNGKNRLSEAKFPKATPMLLSRCIEANGNTNTALTSGKMRQKRGCAT